mgnify:CR=1 FL=1
MLSNIKTVTINGLARYQVNEQVDITSDMQ